LSISTNTTTTQAGSFQNPNNFIEEILYFNGMVEGGTIFDIPKALGTTSTCLFSQENKNLSVVFR